VSLWVVLMVPVSAFAAVVAMAGPQRLAAESSMQEAADDLAMFTVAWRDGNEIPGGSLPAFPPDCEGIRPALETEHEEATEALHQLKDVQSLPDGDPMVVAANERLDAADAAIRVWETDWEVACRLLAESLMRDLGHLGLEAVSLKGSYSDSFKGSPRVMESGLEVPCRTSEATAGRDDVIVVSDAVHVALAADWGHAGWAAAQVWRDGLPMAAESIGRLSQYQSAAPSEACGTQFQVLDRQGRPVWAEDPAKPSRLLVQSVPRTALSN